MITGLYQVNENDLETHETLDSIDLGAWYIIVNGSMIFRSNEHECRQTINMLRAIK